MATAALAVASRFDAGFGNGKAEASRLVSRRASAGRSLCGGGRLLGWWHIADHGRGKGSGTGVVSPRALLDAARYRQEKAAREAMEEEDEEEGTCPVDCVREFNTASEFEELLAESKRDKSLVVVDFYRTACGSCKYIEKGFMKLCKGSGNNNASVTFLKHNVMDEYEEQSDVAAGYKIRNVPLFHFYKDGDLVEAFTTREKSKILAAIYKHTGQLPDVPEAQAG